MNGFVFGLVKSFLSNNENSQVVLILKEMKYELFPLLLGKQLDHTEPSTFQTYKNNLTYMIYPLDRRNTKKLKNQKLKC